MADRLVQGGSAQPVYIVNPEALDGEFVKKSGDNMTGLLILSGDPSADLGAATKQYVDDNFMLSDTDGTAGNFTKLDADGNAVDSGMAAGTVSGNGFACGSDASAISGGAIGQNTKTSDGFAGGKDAKTESAPNFPIDAIQLGTGTNPNAGTLQVYGNQLLDPLGNIPAARMSAEAVIHSTTTPVVFEPFDTPTWLSEASTFTSWGSTAGAFPKSDSITIKVRSWDASNLISRVRLRILSGNKNGDVVFDDEVALAPTFNTEQECLFTFTDPIGDGVQNYWIEFYTNGRSGHYGAIVDYATERFYSTSLTEIDNNPPSLPSAGGTVYAIWYQTQPVDEFDLSPAPDVSNFIVEQQKTASDIDRYKTWMLRRWNTKAAQLRYGSSVYLNVGVIGDSWTNAGYRVVDPIIAQLSTAGYTIGGEGWSSASTGNAPATGTSRVLTGSWTEVNSSTESLGPALTHLVSTTTSDAATFTTTASLSWEIHYRSQSGGGQFRWQVAGGGWTTVDTDATAAHRVVTVGAAGDLEIEVTAQGTNGVILLGVVSIGNSDGVIVHKLGRSGSRASTWTQVNTMAWINAITALNLDTAIILLGTNDMSQSVTPSDYYDDIATLISRLRYGNPAIDILLVSPSDNGLTGKPYTMMEYADSLLDLAQAGDFAWLSLWQQFGSYTDANGETLVDRGIYGDSVHPSQSGGNLIGKAIAEILL